MLTDIEIKKAKPTDKPQKLSDSGGLFLLITPQGSKLWRLAYHFGGKQKTLYIGAYPTISLIEARERRDESKKQLVNGIDPSENKKAVKQAKAASTTNSFEIVAREWYERNMIDKSDSHKKRTLANLERDVFPWIGSKSIIDIKAPELLTVVRRVEDRGAVETGRRILQVCGLIIRYGIATGRLENDVSQALKGSLKPVIGGHFGAVTDPYKLGALLRAIDDYSGSFLVKCALQLAPMVFVRPGELRAMEWAHIDLDAKEWRYFVTKTKVQHIVPLSDQVINILTELKPLSGHVRFVFPSERTPNGSRCISDMALLAALRRMGFTKEEVTIHGFRATARTILDEVLGFRPDFIEHQLAHAVRDPNGRAYNRTAHITERHKMMQAWADYLDKLKAGAEVIPFTKAG